MPSYETVTLIQLSLKLTVTATGVGQQVPLVISANNPTINITNAQISTGTTTSTAGSGKTYVVSFVITGLNGTQGTATVTVPKADVPSGLTPVVYINGFIGPDAPDLPSQSYTQDATDYFITFTTHFSAHTVTIEFIPTASQPGGVSTTVSNTSQGEGGIPEFPAQLEVALIALLVVVASYMAARRGFGKGRQPKIGRQRPLTIAEDRQVGTRNMEALL